jgi:hypothetical protein
MVSFSRGLYTPRNTLNKDKRAAPDPEPEWPLQGVSLLTRRLLVALETSNVIAVDKKEGRLVRRGQQLTPPRKAEIKASLLAATYRFDPMTCREQALKTVVVGRGTAELYRRELKGADLERFNQDMRELNTGQSVGVGMKQVFMEGRERTVVARALDAVVKTALRTAPEFRKYRLDPCAADFNVQLTELTGDSQALGWCISATLRPAPGVQKGQIMRAVEPCVPRTEAPLHSLLLSYLSSGYLWATGEGPESGNQRMAQWDSKQRKAQEGRQQRKVHQQELEEPTDYTLPGTVLGPTLHEAYYASVMHEANVWLADYIEQAVVEQRLIPFEAQSACIVTFGDEVVLFTRFHKRESVMELWEALGVELLERHGLDTGSEKIRSLKQGFSFGGLVLQLPRSNSKFEHDSLVWRLPDFDMLLRHLVRDRVIHNRLTTVPVRHRDTRKAHRNLKERQARQRNHQERFKVLFPGRALPKKGVRNTYRALHMTFLVSAPVVSVVRYYNVRLRRLAQLHAHCHEQCLPELNELYWLIRKSCHKTLCAKYKCNTVGILLKLLKEKEIDVNLIAYDQLEALRQEIQRKERAAVGLDALDGSGLSPRIPSWPPLDRARRMEPTRKPTAAPLETSLNEPEEEMGELIVEDDFVDEDADFEQDTDFYDYDEGSFENIYSSLDESRSVANNKWEESR